MTSVNELGFWVPGIIGGVSYWIMEKYGEREPEWDKTLIVAGIALIYANYIRDPIRQRAFRLFDA